MHEPSKSSRAIFTAIALVAFSLPGCGKPAPRVQRGDFDARAIDAQAQAEHRPAGEPASVPAPGGEPQATDLGP